MQSLLHAEFARASMAERVHARPAAADEPTAGRQPRQRALRCIVRVAGRPRAPRITRAVPEAGL